MSEICQVRTNFQVRICLVGQTRRLLQQAKRCAIFSFSLFILKCVSPASAGPATASKERKKKNPNHNINDNENGGVKFRISLSKKTDLQTSIAVDANRTNSTENLKILVLFL